MVFQRNLFLLFLIHMEATMFCPASQVPPKPLILLMS